MVWDGSIKDGDNMAYVQTNWSDRVSGSPGQFAATGSVPGNVVLALNDNPSQAGTQVTAARMSNIETELVSLDTFMNNSPVPGSTTLTSSGTFAVPTGVTKIFVRAWAGGGGGAGTGGGAGSGAGSGGSGGFICGWWMGVTAGQVITVTVGAGGSVGSFSVNGGTGGTTTVGAMSAYGGLGGVLENSAAYSIGGVGGSASNNADVISKSGNAGASGTAASDLAGGVGLVSVDGSSAGAGGAANTSASSRTSGMSGGNGKVIINW